MYNIVSAEADRTRSLLLCASQRAALNKPADDLIRAIYEERAPWAAAQTARRTKLNCVYSTLKEDPLALEAWERLVYHLGYQSSLLSIEPGVPGLGPQPGNTFVDALLQLAIRHKEWQRAPESWKPAAPDPRRQFSELVRYLLTCYPVSSFLDAAWFEGFTTEGEYHRTWFLHIGSGQNMRTAPNLPIKLARMQAHHFLQAPADCTIVGALRWGQVRGLGGDEYLAKSIVGSRLDHILPDEPFWTSVIHFFVNNASLMNTGSPGPILDFIWRQRFGDQPWPASDGLIDLSTAPEPAFTMKGRTFPALEKRVQEWHEELARASRRPRRSWNPSGIQPFFMRERDDHGTINDWVIQELLDGRSLQEEGRQMRHCVNTYASDCLKGVTSIWSLRVKPEKDLVTRCLLTIEVNNHRRAIVQVRGRCNRTIESYGGKGRMRTAAEIIHRWSMLQRLYIACAF